MLQALADEDIHPDLLVGTSAGALNAAFLAGHGHTRDSMNALAGIWHEMHNHHLFRIDPRRAVLAVTGKRSSLCSPEPLRSLIKSHLAFTRLEDALIPLSVVAADLRSGVEAVFYEGPAMEAIVASCAIPGLYPPVELAGRILIDGGIANNAALSVAVAAGADRIYVLPSGYPCALTEPPRSALGVVAQATALLLHQRIVADIEKYAAAAEIVVLPPPCPITVSATDFRHSRLLIAEGRRSAQTWLRSRRGAVGDADRTSESPTAHIAVHAHHLT